MKLAMFPSSDLLFVYGTLMRGHRRHGRLLQAHAAYLGRASVGGELYQVPGENFPGAVPGGSWRNRVHGELYRLPQAARALRLLDQVEGCNQGLFRRQRVCVWTGGTRREAWVYFYARPLQNAVPIRSGHFRLSRQAAFQV